MTCLMTVAETKKTFSAFKFFHKHYWNNSSGKYEPVKGRNYGNLLRRYVLYEKTLVAGLRQSLRGISRKQLILNCKNVKADNLQLENP